MQLFSFKRWGIKALRENCPNTEFFQSEYRKIRTRKNSVLGHFSCSEDFSEATQILSLNQLFLIENIIGRVAWWLATCARKPKVRGSSPAASYAQR